MKRRTAFTLVELLVVIAIIALLMSILMPALSRARKVAKSVVCRTNIKQWGLVYSLYAQDNDDSFPQGYESAYVNEVDAWMLGALLPHYKNKNLRMCPSTKTLDRPPAEGLDGGTFIDWGPLKAGWADTLATGSYAFSNWCVNPVPGPYWSGIPRENMIRRMSTKGANAVPLVLDSVFVDIAPKHTDHAPDDGEHERDVYRASTTTMTHTMKYMCIDRHSGGINAVFVDMHVEHVGLKRLWNLKWHKNFKKSLVPPNSGGWPSWTNKYSNKQR
jgi:prepilin-type N-terminal cleavage/methylation domain-containing protein/prepilin-type processing-associated H-X9-DG protein